MAYKRALRYLKDIQHYRLKFSVGGKIKLIGYMDIDWACDIDDRKLIGEYWI